jgi:tryptophan 2,3-dioxygenase
MTGSAADRSEELAAEKALLVKSENDIQRGRQRLRDQQALLMELRADGHDTRQAERLVDLMKASLVEWERHHVMIAERIAYLKSMSTGV